MADEGGTMQKGLDEILSAINEGQPMGIEDEICRTTKN